MSDLVLGVDLDGVCADYEGALRTSVANRRGIDPATLPPQTSTDHFKEWGLSAEGFREAHRLAVTEDRIFRTMAPHADVGEVLWRLSDAGVWIRIITHRLLFNGLHEASAADTAVWLDQHDIPYRDLCFIGDKATVGADLYVDDSPHIIDALRAAGRTAIVFDQPYNQHLDGPRAHGWSDVEALVLDRLDDAPTRASADEQENLGG
jgi:5'(3')-deoxyribonucleotidase